MTSSTWKQGKTKTRNCVRQTRMPPVAHCQNEIANMKREILVKSTKSHNSRKICRIKMAVQYDQLHMVTNNPTKFE